VKSDSILKIIGVTLAICIFCSILVSVSAVLLRPIQEANKELDKQKNILKAAGIWSKDVNIKEAFKKFQVKILELSTGKYVNIDPTTFDLKEAAKNPNTTMVIAPEDDYAKIKRISKYSIVYLLMENDGISRIILPVHGKGLWSTMYGFIALDKDTTTVKGLTFYDHGETPGLGGEIDNPLWQALWNGKQLFDETFSLVLKIIKGKVPENSSNSLHQTIVFHSIKLAIMGCQIDGLSGATITANGVNGLIKFWFGPKGYGPYIKNLRKSENV